MILVMGLSKYNLTESKLHSLGKTRIFVCVYVRPATQKRLFKLPPNERKARMVEVRLRNYETLLSHWPGEKPELIGSKRSPGGLLGWLAAKDLRKLHQLPVQDIWVEKIEGRKPIVKRTSAAQQYFGVRARYAIQVEGYTHGLQTYEERILLVRAITLKEAEELVRKDAAFYGEPYLNSDGEMVRWALEKIIDIYDTISSEVTHSVFEVYSELRSRRMKPEYVWNPRREK